MNQPRPQFDSTIQALLYDIERFLKLNPHISEESFGWFSIKQSNLLDRLRNGGDLSTRNLDRVIAYMRAPVTTNRKELPHGKANHQESAER